MPDLTPPGTRPLDGLTNATSVEISEVLYEAERPIVFLTSTFLGLQMLALFIDEQADASVYVLAPLSGSRLEELRSGALTVRDALAASWLWLCWEDTRGLRVWATSLDELPHGYLPEPGVPLLPEHRSVLVTRAIGDTIKPGATPASVVAFVADATRKAVKGLLNYVTDTRTEGRPREEHRTLYDLPIQRFAFASFEVAFGAPPATLFANNEDLRSAVAHLERGLRWASSDEGPLEASSDKEREAILRAVTLLTPPASGLIREVSVSGAWMKHGTVRLRPAARARAKAALRLLEEGRCVTYCARLGEVDRDRLTFILRDIPDSGDLRGSFSEDLLEDVVQYFAENQLVMVAGVESRGQLRISAIAPAASETEREVTM